MVRFTEISSGLIVLMVLLSVDTLLAYECEGDPIPLGRSTFDKKFKKWSGNEFVYKFDENLPNDFKAAFISATEQIANVSCLKFTSFEDATLSSRFLFVYQKLVPKKQDCRIAGGVVMWPHDSMSLSSSCEFDLSQNQDFIALIVHELFHALGFHHTQKRSDRDQYVTFHNESLEDSEKASQFKICSDEDCDYHNMPYDCKSIMHYQAWTFGTKSRCSESDPSGCPLRGKTDECNKALHERHDKMTETDIKHLNLLYPCSTTTTTTTTTTVSADSCNGKCSGKSPDRSCWCDQHCEQYEDCCIDRYGYTC